MSNDFTAVVEAVRYPRIEIDVRVRVRYHERGFGIRLEQAHPQISLRQPRFDPPTDWHHGPYIHVW